MNTGKRTMGVGIGSVSARWLILAGALLAVMAAGYAVSVHRAKAATTGDDELAGSSVTREEKQFSIAWETYPDNKEIDGHPAVPANGGERIFPDKKTYDDSSADKRLLVFAVVTFTENQPPGTKVKFKLWDVDDPSDDDGPIDADDHGPDNLGGSWDIAGVLVEVGKIKRFDGESDVEKEPRKTCKVAVRVSLQPGDNGRVSAALEENADALSRMTQYQADHGVPPEGVKKSEMLTVWRKVHIEVDSMQPDTEATNWLEGIIRNATNNPGTNQTDLEVDDVPGWWSDWDVDESFKNGYIKVANETSSPWLVESFDASVLNDDVFVAGNHESANGKAYWLGDDDYESYCGDLVLIVSYPRDPDTAWLESRLAKAYIEPEFNLGTADGNLTFDRNLYVSVNPWGEFLAFLSTDWNTETHKCKAYWATRLVSAHQPQCDEDNDPDTEGVKLGATAGRACVVFLETSRDFFVEKGLVAGADELAMVVHEVGHTLGATDLATDEGTAGVMWEPAPFPSTWYGERSIKEMREDTHATGGE